MKIKIGQKYKVGKATRTVTGTVKTASGGTNILFTRPGSAGVKVVSLADWEKWLGSGRDNT